MKAENLEMNELNLDDLENVTGGVNLVFYQAALDALVQHYNETVYSKMDHFERVATYESLKKELERIKKLAYEEHQVDLKPNIEIKHVFA